MDRKFREGHNFFTLNALISNPELPNATEFNIYVDRVESPNSFYAQIVNLDNVNDYQVVRQELDRLKDEYNYKIDPPVPTSVIEGTCWAAKCVQDGNWYRARVLSPDNKATDSKYLRDKFLVCFIDYGSVKWISYKNLRPLCKPLVVYPAFVFKFSLGHIAPLNCTSGQNGSVWSSAANVKFNKLINRDRLFRAQLTVDGTNEVSTIPIILFPFDRALQSKSINFELVEQKLAKFLPQCEYCNRECDVNAEFNNWDPMANDFYSDRNIYGLDLDDPGVLTTGRSAGDEKQICFDFNRRGCNNPYCKFEHKFFDEATLGTESIIAKATRVIDELRPGMRVIISVTSVFNATHFFVILPFGVHDVVTLKSSEFDSETYLAVEKDIKALRSELNDYYKVANLKTMGKNPSDVYSLSQIVACKIQGIWYRGRIIEIYYEDKLLEVECIDYGFNEIVDEKDVAPLLPKFLYLPTQAIECFLNNVEFTKKQKRRTCKASSTDFFTNCIKGKFLIATIEKCDIDAVYVNLYDTSVKPHKLFNDILVSRGFAKKTNYI